MHRFRNLMVGLTRSGADGGLIRYAALVAQLGTAHDVSFVHVLSAAGDPSTAPTHDHVLADIQAEVLELFASVPASTRSDFAVLRGSVLDRLLEAMVEHAADLLLVGHRADHPASRSLARRLAMKGPCSVWMVPDGSPPVIRRILVPIDFSEHSADTLEVATELAQRLDLGDILALHVYFNEATISYEGYDQVLRGREADAFRTFLASINCHGVQVTPRFEEGANVAHTIHRVAEQVGSDLIVMATRGRSRSAAVLLGSVTDEVIVDTRVPLLVVKHFGSRLGVLQALLDKSFQQRHGPRFD